MEPIHKEKVFAVITRVVGGELEVLLLIHPDHPEAGIQLPAGTVKPDEEMLAAARREAEEETGLRGLELVGVLGEAEFDARPWGRNELHHRTFVHFRCLEPTADAWEHWEEDPDDAPGERFRFELRWVPLDDSLPDLIGDHGAGIDLLIASPNPAGT